MIIDELTVGMVQTRCYILSPEGGQECIVIDPGDEAARILKAAGNRKIAAILLTHGHFDHIGAVRELLMQNAECRMQNYPLRREKKICRQQIFPKAQESLFMSQMHRC